MDRRKFLSTASFTAVSISAFGHIQLLQNDFKGDCDNTNDILGPFYRPNAPTRQDLTYDGLSGNEELISQMYFQGDPHIAVDPWASDKMARLRILPISLEDISSNLTINFDIVLPDK